MKTVWIVGKGMEHDGWGIESIHASENGAIAAAEWLIKEEDRALEEYWNRYPKERRHGHKRIYEKTQTPSEDNEFDSHMWESGYQFVFVSEHEVEK